ncbi:putative holin-like toxin [Staphylococcus microti]|nr:putative holin-like toxin [Staphylococcus microti]
MVTVAEALCLMISFGSFVVTLLGLVIVIINVAIKK